MESAKPKVVLAGGTGFVGQYLQTQFNRLGHEVIIIARGKDYVQWNSADAICRSLDGASLLVNLAGKSVNCRYTEKNKDAILKSRTETTMALGKALDRCSRPPSLWINSSTATIYRHAEDRPMTEENGEIGTGFSVGIAKQWEEVFCSFKRPLLRQVALRMAIVLGREGGAIEPLANLVRLRMGGRQGSGRQKFSWIHIEDLFEMIRFIQTNKNIDGAVNCSAPNPVDNSMLMKELRKAMNVSVGLPTPRLLLEIGAFMIQTEPELVLKSRWVLPERVLKAGFKFKYPSLDGALKEILG